MATGSANPFPSVLLVEQGSAPATPAASQARLYVDNAASPALKYVDDAGAVVTLANAADVATLVAADKVVTANPETASYTLVLDDAGKAVEMNVASANNLTVPPNADVAFPVGTVIEVCQVGAGQTTIVQGTGVTIRTPETLVMTGQWSTVSLRKRATDEWVLAGDVVAA